MCMRHVSEQDELHTAFLHSVQGIEGVNLRKQLWVNIKIRRGTLDEDQEISYRA